MTSRSKKVGGLIAGAGVGAAAAAALRRRWSKPPEEPPPPPAPVNDAVSSSFLQHLAEAVRIRTVSYEGPTGSDTAALEEFRGFLERTYPGVHAALRREVVADHSLLFTWEGSDRDAQPFLLMAHQDVVPVEPGTEEGWSQPPFSGENDGEYLWGRGTLDDKGALIGILEAVEGLLAEGFAPLSTVYVAFGHDEEVGGSRGAAAIADLLGERGVRLSFALDEGRGVTTGLFPGVSKPVGLIGVGEKGYLNVRLIAKGVGGHSSVPPASTAVGTVAAAVRAIEKHPMPARLDPQRPLLAVLAQAMRGPWAAALRNLDVFGRLVERRLAASPQTNALIRTTAAATMISGGVKPNLLPQEAEAVINFRLLPGDTVATVLDHVRSVVGDGVRVEVLQGGFSAEPSPLADHDSAVFRLLGDTVAEVFPGTVVAPWILMGATDSRFFIPIADNVYRFVPFTVDAQDLVRIHGTGERIRVADAGPAVTFYRRLLVRAGGEA